MKIVCDSCSAKYSIADEKVAGRVFKIRCKKCGAAIVVRGDQVDAAGGGDAEEASTRVVDYGGDAVWHIVVDGEQQGPFAPAQLGEMLSAGTIGWDAFVWREGFDDWKAAQDIEELVQAIMGGSGQPQGGADMGADPFAATQHAASAEPAGGGFAGPAAVAARSDDAGADLFAQADAASPFGGASQDEEDDVVASAPSPRVSADQALTGARNENSVLFSLSNLQALATGPGGGGSSSSASSAGSAPSASPKPGMAQGEGSGLIDIRALASATGVTPGNSGPVTSASNDKVDDLLSIGGGGVGLGSSLGAPVLIPEKKEESSKGPLYFGIAAAAVVFLGLGIGAMVFLGGGDGEDAPVAAAGTVSPGQPVTAAAGAATPANPAEPAQPAQPAEAAPTPQAPAAAPAAAEEAAAEEGGERDGRSNSRRDRDRPRATGGGGGGGGGASAPARPSSGSGGSSRSRGGDDIDSLLAGALEGGGGGARREAPARRGGGGSSSGPQTPSRSDIMSAMNGVQGAVRACGNGARGTAIVRVSFAGNSGRATNAQVNSALPGPVKSCIAAAVRRARVPPFQQANFSVNYPFSL